MRLSGVLFVLASAMGLVPSRAPAHGGEFMLAKVATANGSVWLELTADYGENPMLHDEAEAREALRHVLQVRLGASSRKLDELSPIRFEKRTQFDDDAPLPKAPSGNLPSHQLVTALWQWKPNAAAISFEVPKGNPHNVILWLANTEAPREKTQWLLMIAGDYSPAIPIPQETWSWRRCLGWMGVTLVPGLVLMSWLVKRRPLKRP